MAAAVPMARTPDAETDARRTLRGGVATLAAGLALVGTGAEKEGAVPVLAGLLVTIFGIHTYGRLGPADTADEDGRRAAAMTQAWRGGLVAVAGAAGVVGTSPDGIATVIAYAALVGGGLVMLRGASAVGRAGPAVAEGGDDDERPEPPRRPARASKVENRRRMGKSAPP
jgi:hypothetical protein